MQSHYKTLHTFVAGIDKMVLIIWKYNTKYSQIDINKY